MSYYGAFVERNTGLRVLVVMCHGIHMIAQKSTTDSTITSSV